MLGFGCVSWIIGHFLPRLLNVQKNLIRYERSNRAPAHLMKTPTNLIRILDPGSINFNVAIDPLLVKWNIWDLSPISLSLHRKAREIQTFIELTHPMSM